MITSKKGIELIKKHESFRSCPYLCPAKVPTIGYGNTFYYNGTPVNINDDCITKEQANMLLENILIDFEKAVNDLVKTEINQNQFDALVSFVYNVGKGAFKGSTLLKKINVDPNDTNIKYQFSRWNKAGGKVLNGLTKRREQESNLYFS